MTSISHPSAPVQVPKILPGTDTLTAARAYADANLYILPVARGTKNPGSIVGPGWQHRSSRDHEQIDKWFTATTHGIAIHAGRSGLLVFDVDHPELLRPPLAAALADERVPFQSTRPDTPGRGHYLFSMPPGRQIGNSAGSLGKDWGEVRGNNGVFVATPSVHEKADEGGFYGWERWGSAPVLPPEIDSLCSDANPAERPATSVEVAEFIAAHKNADHPELFGAVERDFNRRYEEGESRHQTAVTDVCWAAREALAGSYPASEAFSRLEDVFVAAKADPKAANGQTVGEEQARSEFDGIVAWAVNQAIAEGMASCTARVGTRVSADHDDWADCPPTALKVQPAPLPVDTLGPVLGPLASAIAESYQVPADLVINLALPLITTAAGGRWTVRVRSDWSETLALASLSALASGERKSPVLTTLQGPLVRAEKERQSLARPRIAQQAADYKLAEDRAGNMRKAAAKTDSTVEMQQSYVAASQQLAEMILDPLPRLLVDDITPETVALRLAEHGSIGAVSAEPGLFSILAGRYSNGSPNVENVLKGISGDRITVDRMGKEPVIVERPALSMGICIQPGRLPELGAKGSMFRNSGLLARFLYVLPEPRVGGRDDDPEPVPDGVLRRWAEGVSALLAAADGEQAILELDPAALGAFQHFRRELEPRLHPEHGDLAGIADFGSKLPGTVVRVAAALALLADPHRATIDEESMRGAICLGLAYVDHTLAAFAAISAHPGRLARIDQAQRALAVILRVAHATFSTRDVYRKVRGQAWVNSAEDVRHALEELAEHGHIRPAPRTRKPGQSGAPSERWELHPSHLAPEAENSPSVRDAPLGHSDTDSGHSGHAIDNDENEQPKARGGSGHIGHASGDVRFGSQDRSLFTPLSQLTR